MSWPDYGRYRSERLWCQVQRLCRSFKTRVVSILVLFAVTTSLQSKGDGSLCVPLINHVFFDSASTRIPDRYYQLSRDDVAQFSIQSISARSDHDAYRHILNVLGLRLSNHQTWTVTLRPYSYGENVDDSVLIHRAENIISYLNEVWAIDSSRLQCDLDARDPVRYNPRSYNGNRTNWRIDIYPSNDSLLAPLWLSNVPVRDSVVLQATVLQWQLDSYDLTASIKLLIAEINAHASSELSGRFVIHGDKETKAYSHWYVLDSKRAKTLKKSLGVNSLHIDRAFSRHDNCSHQYAEECIYKEAMYVEFWK